MTTTPTTTTDPGPFGPIGPPVTASDSPEAAYAVGVQARRPSTELAVPGSAAMVYAEWARLIDGGEPASGQVRSLEDAGFLVDVDEQVALATCGWTKRDWRPTSASAAPTAPAPSSRMSSFGERTASPRPGAATVDSDSARCGPCRWRWSSIANRSRT